MQIVDCRGMACPQPVIAVKHALDNHPGTPLEIHLDRGAPHENVMRFLLNRGITVTESSTAGAITLMVAGDVATACPPPTPSVRHKVILITSDQLGEGPAELGRLLMKNFIIALLDQPALPDRIFFMNSGINLTTDGSEVLTALEKLADNGVEILSCGLCLDFFQKKDLLRAGSTTNMFMTAEALLQAESVIKL